MIQFLVVNNNKNENFPRYYAEQYQMFIERDDAVRHFLSIGGEEDPMGMGLSQKPGVASVQLGGEKDVDVMFMPILVQ
jgi:hypothetical protein